MTIKSALLSFFNFLKVFYDNNGDLSAVNQKGSVYSRLLIWARYLQVRLRVMLQRKVERMRQITTFVDLLQVIWSIPNQAITVYASCSQFKSACVLKTGFGMSNGALVLQMVLCLILSAYPCMLSSL